jgi:hypothetical protein
MSEKIDEVLGNIERLKEVQRIQFDYFKHLTTVSSGAILILVAFLEKIFSNPKGVCLIIISLVAFGVCLIGSILPMTHTTNAILYATGIRISYDEDNKERAKSMNEKLSRSLNGIVFYDYLTKISLIIGFTFFIIFSAINFYV